MYFGVPASFICYLHHEVADEMSQVDLEVSARRRPCFKHRSARLGLSMECHASASLLQKQWLVVSAQEGVAQGGMNTRVELPQLENAVESCTA